MSVDKVGTPSVIMLQNSEETLAVELGGDTNAQIAAMMLKHGTERRAANRQMRQQEENHLSTAEGREIAKLREQAKETLVASRQKAFGRIAGGALGCAGGVVGASSARTGAQNTSHALKGAQSGVEGGAELMAADSQKRASDAEIESKEAAHRSGEAKRRMEDLKDDEQGAKELVRNAIDFLKSISDAKAEVERAALFNRV